MLMLMIGYSSYALIVIRSSANPPMNKSPEDIFTLGSYVRTATSMATALCSMARLIHHR